MIAAPPVQASAIVAPGASDRFIGFAFAAADLLAELHDVRQITFAAGAFRERFGQDGDHFEGKPFATLIAPEDHGDLAMALSLLACRGRLAPVTVRLANAERTPMALAGLRLPHRSGMTWLTLSRMPAPPTDVTDLAAAPVLRQTIEARLLNGALREVGLVEVGGWARLPEAARRRLEHDIASVMRGAGGIGGMAGELAEGRFGVLGDKVIDMPDMADRVARVLHTAGARQPVMATSIPLGDGAPGPAETMRVMRYALACFATGGVGAVRAAGFDHGLPNFLAHAEPRATGVLDALENGRFRLVFQPVVRLSDRAVHHYEALLRPLPIPGQDKCTPQEFVAFAEALGLAEALDLAVLRRTLETIVRTPARVAVNISGMSMQSPSLCNTLFQLLEKHAAAQGRLLIELTETADITDMPAAVATVNRLVAAGVPVCLDDFGAGFAAFRYLKEFPVNFVKIDGAYVRNAQSGARDSGFVGVMVELARGVGAQTIAEMIETEAQAATMRALGVEFGQGWLFGRPGLLPGSLQA